MPNINNGSLGAVRTGGRKLLVVLVTLALIALIIIWVVSHRKHESSSTLPLEQHTAPAAQAYLNSHDYTSYQITQTTVADDYIVLKEYASAERLLNEIVAKVPSNKITAATYQSYWYLYQQKGDTQNRKKYALLTAEKFKEEGDTKSAALFEKDATKN